MINLITVKYYVILKFSKILRKIIKEYLIAFFLLKQKPRMENCKNLFDNTFFKENLMIIMILKIIHLRKTNCKNSSYTNCKNI